MIIIEKGENILTHNFNNMFKIFYQNENYMYKCDITCDKYVQTKEQCLISPEIRGGLTVLTPKM